nr:MAG TPA: hypothetical protein [Caudoviricetes sp.]
MYVNTVNRHENEIYFLTHFAQDNRSRNNGSHVFLCFFICNIFID